MQGNRPRVVSCVVLLLLLGCATPEDGPGPKVDPAAIQPAVPAKVGPANSEARVQAAISARESERARRDSAFRTYRRLLDEDPGTPQRLVVSFTQPVRAHRLLPRLAESNSAIDKVFLWLQEEPASVFVAVAEYPINPLEWKDSAAGSRTADELQTRYELILNRRMLNLDRLATSGSNEAVLIEQRQATERLLDNVRNSGVLIYGISCVCSAQQVAAFGAPPTIAGVEVFAPSIRPIWPFDPARDKIIETGGTYGR